MRLNFLFVGFQDLATDDQATMIRLGQSQSRILVAATHWYDPNEKKFHDFLSWRSEDLFKKKLIEYADVIHGLELDRIESAVLNILILIATGMFFYSVIRFVLTNE